MLVLEQPMRLITIAMESEIVKVPLSMTYYLGVTLPVTRVYKKRGFSVIHVRDVEPHQLDKNSLSALHRQTFLRTLTSIRGTNY